MGVGVVFHGMGVVWEWEWSSMGVGVVFRGRWEWEWSSMGVGVVFHGSGLIYQDTYNIHTIN